MSALIVLLAFVAVQLAAAYIGVMWSDGTPDPVILGRTLLVLEGALAVVLWRVARKRMKSAAFEPSRVTLRLVIKAVVFTLLAAFALSFLMQPFELTDSSALLFDGMKSDPLCLLTICVVGPLTEELVFRAHIIPSLRANGLPPVACAALSALAFALIHGNLSQGVPAFLIGTVFGLFFLRTGDLRLCLPAHIANNSVAALLLFLSDPADKFPPVAAVLLGAACLIAAFVVYKIGEPLFFQPRTSPK